jgi:opine dehydrogenase
LKIAVLGGGNGSFAAAGDFALQGHDVRLWRRDADLVAAQRGAGSRVVVKDSNGRHDVQLTLVTTDIADAVSEAQLILCPAPAFAQMDIAHALAPHLRDGQVVFLPPATFGSMIFANAAREAGNRAEVSFAETGTLPWLTRKHGPFEVAITIRAKRLPVGVFPLRFADRALDVIGRAFPDVIEPCGDALSGALMNAGPIIHPPLIVMNAGPIEHFERWDIHKEGTQAAIRRVTDALDAERIAMREALGYGAPHFPLTHHYAKEGEIWMYGRGSHDRLTDSGDWRERIVLSEHRYMREDLRLGLSLLVSVAELAGVATPLAKSFLAIGGAICSEDFSRTGRTLDSLGFGKLNRRELQHLLREGFAE